MKTRTITTSIEIESSALKGGDAITREVFAVLLDRFGYRVDSAGIEGEFARIKLVQEVEVEDERTMADVLDDAVAAKKAAAQEAEVTDRVLPFAPNKPTAGLEAKADDCDCPACNLRRMIAKSGGAPVIVSFAELFGKPSN